MSYCIELAEVRVNDVSTLLLKVVQDANIFSKDKDWLLFMGVQIISLKLNCVRL